MYVEVIKLFTSQSNTCFFHHYFQGRFITLPKDTLIEHKEIVIICEENGPINLSYNVLLNTLEVNTIVKHVVVSHTDTTMCGSLNF